MAIGAHHDEVDILALGFLLDNLVGLAGEETALRVIARMPQHLRRMVQFGMRLAVGYADEFAGAAFEEWRPLEPFDRLGDAGAAVIGDEKAADGPKASGCDENRPFGAPQDPLQIGAEVKLRDMPVLTLRSG